MKHRIIDTDFGEVMVMENGDCYIGDNYDNYVCSIFHRNILNANSNRLADLFEKEMHNDTDNTFGTWNDCEATFENR